MTWDVEDSSSTLSLPMNGTGAGKQRWRLLFLSLTALDDVFKPFSQLMLVMQQTDTHCPHLSTEGWSPSAQHCFHYVKGKGKEGEKSAISYILEQSECLKMCFSFHSHSKGNLHCSPLCPAVCRWLHLWKNARLWHICCCVRDAKGPTLFFSQWVSYRCVCPSVHQSFPSAHQPLSGISTCKYCLIPPPLPSALPPSLFCFLPPLTSILSPPLSMALIHSLIPSACLCAPPPSIHSCDFFSCLYLSTAISLLPPRSLKPPCESYLSPPSAGVFHFGGFGI